MKQVGSFKRVPGQGVRGEVEGKEIFVGHRGGDNIVVEADGKMVGEIAVGDTVREESKVAVKQLKQLGVKVVMITGDAESTASQVADELELDEYYARVMPGDKAYKVKELQAVSKKLCWQTCKT